MGGPTNGLLGLGPMSGPPQGSPLPSQGIPMPSGPSPQQMMPGPPQGIAMPSQGGLLGQPAASPSQAIPPPPPDHSAAPTDPRMIELRQRYEDKLPKLKTEAQYRDHWLDYMNKAKKIDPGLVLYPDQWKINFPEKYPEYAGGGPVPR